MPFLASNDHQRRIVKLSQDWGVVLPPAPRQIPAPQIAPSFRRPGDDEAAEELLQRRVVEVTQLQPKRTLSRAFSSNTLKKGKSWDPQVTLYALEACVNSYGSPGVAEALIGKLAAAGVDLGGLQKQKSMLNLKKTIDTSEHRAMLLRSAVEKDQHDMTQVLVPHADPLARDACLAIAIRNGNAPIAELLLRYRANVVRAPDGQGAFRQACATPDQSRIVRLVLESENPPPTSWTSQSMADAAVAACLDTVLHLSRSTADGNHDRGIALKTAVDMGRRDIAVAIVMGNKPPQQPVLDEAFGLLFEHPSHQPAVKLDIAELLLCAGAKGDVVSRALERSCETQFYDMTYLLASYGVSIEYNDASVLKTAISREQIDLVDTLLGGKSALNPSLASSCVRLIPKLATFEVRHSLLTSLLKRGANGIPLSECLIDAAEAGDVNSVDLLLIPHFPNGQGASPNARRTSGSRNFGRHEIASVNYKSGQALRNTVLRADTVMTQKILAGQPSPETLTAVFPLTKNLAAPDRYRIVELFLKGPIPAPCLHGALQDAITEDASRRNDALIKLLLSHNADVNFKEGTGLHSVILQKDLSLLAALVRKASPQTAAARVPDVMKVTDDHPARHGMMNILLQAGAAIGTNEVATALLDTLKERRVDLSLLQLLLQQGQADINALDGAIIRKAVRNPDPRILELVLGHEKLVGDATGRCLTELAPLPSTEGKTVKLNLILSRASPKPDLNGMLGHEVQSLLRNNTEQPSMSTLKLLLDSGANPNAHEAGALCQAVIAANTPISDMLLESQLPPNPTSLGGALRHALKISVLMDRLSFTKRLVDAGASPGEVNQALIYAIGAYPDDISLLNVLASGANASDGEGLSLSVSKGSPDILALLLKKTQHSVEVRNTALQKAMVVGNRIARLSMCRLLLASGVSNDTTSNVLLLAARDGDLQLVEVLVAHGADISSNDGQAVIEACGSGSVEVLKMLLKTDVDTAEGRTLERGFQAATQIGDLNKRALIFQQLLGKGVGGLVVDAELHSAVRYGESGQGVLKVLLAAGADPNHNDGEAVCAATRSAFVGNLEMLLGLWEQGRGQKKASGATLVRALKTCWNLNRDSRFRIIDDLMRAGLPVTDELHIALNSAVNEDDPEERLVKRLLDHGASPVTNGCKTLVDATQKMASESLSLLLGKEIPQDDLNSAFFNSFSAENFVVWFTDSGLKTASMLLAKGAQGDAISGALVLVMKNCTAETQALALDYFDLLVAHEPDVNFNGGEPLQYAASKAMVYWTRELLSLRPTAETVSGAFHRIFDTALTEDDALALFTLFAEHQDGEGRVDVMAPNPGEPVLVRAISQYPRSTKILQTLLDVGYYPDPATRCTLFPDAEEEEVTFLIWAIAQPQKRVSNSVIEMLVDRGAKVNVQTEMSKTSPLMLAIQKQRPEVVRILLLNQADADVFDIFDRTPLSLATQLEGTHAIQMLDYLLARDPSKDDGSLHNAARNLNLPAVQLLVQAGHDPDFPSPNHGGRSALGEMCRHSSDGGELSLEREKAMEKVMAFLVASGSDLLIKANNKSMLYLCFDAVDPIVTARVFLKVGMWKHINKPFNYHTDDTHTYSPTMYIQHVLSHSDNHDRLLSLLRDNRATDVYYATSGPQPKGATGLPEDLALRERARQARLERMTEDEQDFSLTLARRRELATVDQQIYADRARTEDSRRQRLHGEDLAALRSRAQLEDSIATTTTQRRVSEQRAITDAAVARTRAIAASEVDAEKTRQRRALEWEGVINRERVDNAQALSAIRASERSEVDRLDSAADGRLRRRMEAQERLIEGQERLARTLAAGPGGGARQIGYVTEMDP